MFNLNKTEFIFQFFIRQKTVTQCFVLVNQSQCLYYEISFVIFYRINNFIIIRIETNIPKGFSLGNSESRVVTPPGLPANPQVNLQFNFVYPDSFSGLTARLEG